jgi:hypothetical protein
MNEVEISESDRAVRFVRLSYGCLLAEAIDIVFALSFSNVLPILWLLVVILPLAGAVFGILGVHFSSTETVSKKAYRAELLNAGVIVLILLLAILSIRPSCACDYGNVSFVTISAPLP